MPRVSSPPTPDPAEKLPRQLGLLSATAVLIGSTIGSGIFRSPAGIAAKVPGALPLLSVWVAGGFFALCGALTLAEIAGAFLFGWAELVVIRAASYGAISTTFAEYFFRVLGYDPSVAPTSTYVHWVAAVAIAIGLPQSGGHFTPLLPEGSFHLGAFGLALVSVLWAYDGWEDVTFVAGEVRDPRRVMPRAIIMGTLAVVSIYLLANVAYLSVLDVQGIAHSKLVAAEVAQRLIGPAGVVFVSVTV